MKLSDLFEKASLPLLPKQMANFRGNYGAFIISMSPQDFLLLTSIDAAHREEIAARPFPQTKDQYAADMGRESGFGRYSMPFLNVEFPSGKVVGHEGRHRTNMVMQAGGKSIPIVIYPREEKNFRCTLTYSGDDYVDHELELGNFPSYQDAERAFEEKKAEMEDEFYVHRRPRIDNLGGGALKGAPERSDRSQWQWAAWKKEDFPKQLIGQYDESVHVTNYRIGLVKGYRHHK